MNMRRHISGEEGSTLPEVMVAGAITLVALTMVGGTVLAPLGVLGRVAEPDLVARELDAAADAVVRIVRAARPGPDGPAVAPDPDGIVVRLAGESGDLAVRIVIIDDRLLAVIEGSGELPLAFAHGPLAAGLDGESSVLAVVDAPVGWSVGAALAHQEHPAVHIRLRAAGRETVRVERIRGERWR
jgi:hypothetical protein